MNKAAFLLTVGLSFLSPAGAQNSPCDLDRSGSVNVTDVQLSVNMSLGLAPCTANIAGSGVCNVVVVQRMVNAALGGACITGSGTGTTRNVLLSWTASTSPNIAGHNVYRASTSGGQYTKLNTSLVTATSFTDTTVQNGLTYYYVVTAVNTSNTESAYSNSAPAVVPSS